MYTIELEDVQIDKIVVTELKATFNSALDEGNTLLALSVVEVLKCFMTDSEYKAWKDSVDKGD